MTVLGRGLVLDPSTLRAHAAGDIYTQTMIGWALENERPIVIPALALAESYRTAATQQARERITSLTRLAEAVDSLDAAGGRDVGLICAFGNEPELAHGHTALVALLRRRSASPLYDWAIVTEEPDRYRKIAPAVPTGWR
ncbi:hypothetical protein N5079_25145 [Planotetraspora sp. A-T 1434]|uniref:hypothetical protein n=1 Tax=Planotetraspora sp. A-T 1434 TaxID=2979219 RepID=UPI0021BFF9B7|nr:hypothetical protein [Planotetraspora sp. A-T 1434]MCT9933504.1 hypothetical protein [Planotetraspora sp. A-T 1434]